MDKFKKEHDDNLERARKINEAEEADFKAKLAREKA